MNETKTYDLGLLGIPDYRVSSDGRVQTRRSNAPNKPKPYWRDLSPVTDTKGYQCVTLCGPEGLRYPRRVHRLVAQCFLPNPAGHPCVRHKDGNPKNNRVENLSWGTYKDNEDDKRAHGTWALRMGGAKLSLEDVARVRELFASGMSQINLAAAFDVSRPTITRLLNRTTWKQDENIVRM